MLLPWALVDYDDTVGGVEIEGVVVPNHRAYTHAKACYASAMIEFGFLADEALALHAEIDMAAARREGFGNKTRFAYSMVEAYSLLTQKYARAYLANEADFIFEIGMGVFAHPYRALPGALAMLQSIAPYFHIAIVTKGEIAEQIRKVKESGVVALVDRVIVAERKDDAEWKSILNRLGVEPAQYTASWAIGNSIKADVNPLIRLGFNGIHLRDPEEWVFEQAAYEEPRDGQVLRTIDRITEVLGILPR